MNLPPSNPFKAFLDRRLPWLYRPLRESVAVFRRRRFERRYRKLVEAIFARTDGVVQSGPFAGMRYIDAARSSALLPKVIGTYEDELHLVFEELLETAYADIVDIGCAEGYYAVGLALRLPAARVHAYDQEATARALCRDLAERNGVADRVLICDRFTTDHLCDLPVGRTLAICDVDGFEVDLFGSSTGDDWKNCDLIVELHDCLALPCRETVTRCLAKTHDLEIVPSRIKSPPMIGALEGLEEADRRLAVDEIRPPQEWLIARSIAWKASSRTHG